MVMNGKAKAELGSAQLRQEMQRKRKAAKITASHSIVMVSIFVSAKAWHSSG